MKKSILILAILLTGSVAFSQATKTSDMPELVTTRFAALYPSSMPEQWEKVKGNYETKFTLSKEKMHVVINAGGNVVETSTTIKTAELPKGVEAYIGQNYGRQKITDACITTEADGKVKYGALIKGTRLSFDSNGVFMKSEKCKN